jgi:hypothetical protein
MCVCVCVYLLVCYLNKFVYCIEVHAEVTDFENVKFRNFKCYSYYLR